MFLLPRTSCFCACLCVFGLSCGWRQVSNLRERAQVSLIHHTHRNTLNQSMTNKAICAFAHQLQPFSSVAHSRSLWLRKHTVVRFWQCEVSRCVCFSLFMSFDVKGTNIPIHAAELNLLYKHSGALMCLQSIFVQ